MVGEQYTHSSNALGAGVLTTEQRLQNLEKALVQMLDDGNPGVQDTRLASEYLAFAKDPSPKFQITEDPTCEERVSRLEEQLALLIDSNGRGGKKVGSKSCHGFDDDGISTGGHGLCHCNSRNRGEFLQDKMARADHSSLFTRLTGVYGDEEEELAMRGVLRDDGNPEKPAVILPNGDHHVRPGLFGNETEKFLQGLDRDHAAEQFKAEVPAKEGSSRKAARQGSYNDGVAGGAASINNSCGIGPIEMGTVDDCALM